MTITAEEARILVKKYNPNIGKEIAIGKILSEIYSRIHSCAYNGISKTEMVLKPYALEYKEDIRSILVKEGYKVKFKHIDNFRDCEDYIKISWDA
jgi:hypothetical protein